MPNCSAFRKRNRLGGPPDPASVAPMRSTGIYGAGITVSEGDSGNETATQQRFYRATADTIRSVLPVLRTRLFFNAN